ncbi:hypothetical protein MesoLjLc_53820 [Mesorhizobium sp. L-8-10]|uniref:ExbD/TolR family protein n=1 Tax=Mesorhizobium sp. L-8-10 TaxID=2744523 RepID=UPI001926AEB2|nr:biopolymer transporter ExbD [Mesorhizobium sp. L-8-10]BCH33452.1 hypothetical protein MesoLjLc_53820 [Mesorhizobium sp. L-8-10]
MGRHRIRWQPARRRALFALTPLIDIMFLLLIFFMLSSQIAPYSLMPIGNVATGIEDGNQTGDAARTRDLAIRVSHGFVSVGGEAIPFEELQPALSQLISRGSTGFLLIATRSASVQDIVTTLEALQAVSAGRVTLVDATGSTP